MLAFPHDAFFTIATLTAGYTGLNIHCMFLARKNAYDVKKYWDIIHDLTITFEQVLASQVSEFLQLACFRQGLSRKDNISLIILLTERLYF